MQVNKLITQDSRPPEIETLEARVRELENYRRHEDHAEDTPIVSNPPSPSEEERERHDLTHAKPCLD